MNIKRFVLSAIIIFIVSLLWNGFVHSLILNNDEEILKSLLRPDIMDKMWLSLVLTALISIIFVFGYTKFSIKGTTWEGIMYGISFGVLAVLLVDVNQYILYPLSLSIVIKWMIFGILEFTLYGFLVSMIYKKIFILKKRESESQ